MIEWVRSLPPLAQSVVAAATITLLLVGFGVIDADELSQLVWRCVAALMIASLIIWGLLLARRS